MSDRITPSKPDAERVRPTLRKPTDALSARARTRLQARGIPAEVVTGRGREVADKVKAWCKDLVAI